tara:strand:- start:101 stop:811 length:711 start_codon:yes stop_codon:yes gene_type:complete
MNHKFINLKNLIFVFIIIAVFHNFNSARNFYSIIQKDYNQRLVNSYEFCRNESIGFLDYIKKKYKINNSIVVKNFFISPDPSWFFLDSQLNQTVSDKIILLGYKENQIINFKNKEGFYISEDIKFLKKIKKISFFVKKKSEKKISFTIYQSFYGENKSIYKSDLIDLKIGENIINLNLDILNSFNNSKMIIKFGNVNSDKNFVIDDVNLFIPNEIDLSKRVIFEKYKNCYLVSKNG